MQPLKLLLCFLVGTSSLAHAAPMPDLSQYFRSMEDHPLKGMVGYTTTEVPGSGMALDKSEALGTASREQSDRCDAADCQVGHSFGASAMASRQTKMEASGFTRGSDGMVNNQKGFLDRALHTVKHADQEFGVLQGGMVPCTPTIETVVHTSEHTCDRYVKLEANACFPKQVVEIDPKYNYACSKKREIKEKICTEIIKTIRCRDSHDCDMGGIQAGSVASDMKFVYEHGELTIGTIANNYWSGTCTIYDRSTTFQLKHVAHIKEFRLVHVGFDDYMEIFINGRSVYAGPDGGQNLQVVTRKTDRGGSYHVVNNGSIDRFCERNTDWSTPLNIDLRPYLKEGDNSIKIRVIVSGFGEGWLKIRAKQHCCTSWDITREEQCQYM